MTTIAQATVPSPRLSLSASFSAERSSIPRPRATHGFHTTAAVAWIEAMRADGFVFVRRHLQEGVNDFAMRRRAPCEGDDTNDLISLIKCG